MRIPSREHANNMELFKKPYLDSVKNTVGIIEIYKKEIENVPYIKLNKEVSTINRKKSIESVCGIGLENQEKERSEISKS